jgi:hypothetical protein
MLETRNPEEKPSKKRKKKDKEDNEKPKVDLEAILENVYKA